jgi:hypothetical protein
VSVLPLKKASRSVSFTINQERRMIMAKAKKKVVKKAIKKPMKMRPDHC